jgi:hypothetical protein
MGTWAIFEPDNFKKGVATCYREAFQLRRGKHRSSLAAVRSQGHRPLRAIFRPWLT